MISDFLLSSIISGIFGLGNTALLLMIQRSGAKRQIILGQQNEVLAEIRTEAAGIQKQTNGMRAALEAQARAEGHAKGMEDAKSIALESLRVHLEAEAATHPKEIKSK